jgi:excisionase family DNA binding protein
MKASLPRQQRRYGSIAEAADLVGTSTRTVRRRIADGSLTGYRMGPRLIRVDLAELDAMFRPIPTAEAVDLTGGAA